MTNLKIAFFQCFYTDIQQISRQCKTNSSYLQKSNLITVYLITDHCKITKKRVHTETAMDSGAKWAVFSTAYNHLGVWYQH